MNTTEVKASTVMEVVVREQTLFDKIVSLEDVQPFDKAIYERENSKNDWNMTMLPGAQMVSLPAKLLKELHQYTADHSRSGVCSAQYKDVPGHAVHCVMGKNHKGPHINQGCFDINAVWE